MSAAVLVDTNVLVYATDEADRVKNAAALEVLRVLGSERVVVSGQVLAEYANVLTHPAKHARGASLVARDIERMAAIFGVLPLDASTVITALAARERWQLEYYDAQIWAAAALNGIDVVLSEDFPAGAMLGDVTFINPFAEGFDPFTV